MIEIRDDGNEVSLCGDDYELTIKAHEPWRAVLKVKGMLAAELFVPSACDADGQQDVIENLAAPEARLAPERPAIAVAARSRLWGEVSYVFEGRQGQLEYFAQRRGRHHLDVMEIFSGRYGTTGEARSQANWRAVFNPEPNARRKHLFAPGEFATIGVSSDPDYYRGNWFFTPGPLCYSLDLDKNGWMAAGIAAEPGTNNFDHYEYQGTPDGFGFHLRYDGHVFSPEQWESPHLVFIPAKDELEALGAYCTALRTAALTPGSKLEQHDWWWEPIFCGWGEQVAIERRTSLTTLPPVIAADCCTQANYEQFLIKIEQQGLAPGTVVIDDKWQKCYGLNAPDAAKWPDMAGFIDRQHRAGRRVLLWLRAWNPEGLPAAECLLNETGEALAVDPSSAQYEERLRRQVRSMLLGLGADGFKIDFTHRLPVERNVRSAAGVWGLELLRRLLSIVHDEAKQAKADALIMAHTANPYFADIVDMLRLNDIANVVGSPSFLDSMLVREKVARLASPHWIVDTDNWPSPNRAAWLEYCHEQPTMGVPSLYYATRIYHLAENGEITDELLGAGDYAEIRTIWAAYRERRGNGDAK